MENLSLTCPIYMLAPGYHLSQSGSQTARPVKSNIITMHPLYSINDEPPCTPLPIVKQVFLGSRTGKGFEEKRRGVHLHPLGGDFAPPKLDKFCHFSICSISQYGFFKISLPTPIKSAALFFRRVSASSKVLTPPVSMTGMETAFFIALDIS